MPRGLIPESFVQQSELLVWNDAMGSVYKHDCCAICTEAFNPSVPDIVRVLGCRHVFHAKCVDLWFIKATFCPLCKNDLKCHFKNSSSRRSLGHSSHSSSQRSIGSRSWSSLRSGQILVGHSNSDPALLRGLQDRPVVQENSALSGVIHFRASQPLTPDRQLGSATPLSTSLSDRSLPILGSSRSEPSVGILSSSSSGGLPAVQEVSEETRAADDSQQSNSVSPLSASPEHLLSARRSESGDHFATSPFFVSGSSAASSSPVPAPVALPLPAALPTAAQQPGQEQPSLPWSGLGSPEAQTSLEGSALGTSVQQQPHSQFGYPHQQVLIATTSDPQPELRFIQVLDACTEQLPPSSPAPSPAASIAAPAGSRVMAGGVTGGGILSKMMPVHSGASVDSWAREGQSMSHSMSHWSDPEGSSAPCVVPPHAKRGEDRRSTDGRHRSSSLPPVRVNADKLSTSLRSGGSLSSAASIASGTPPRGLHIQGVSTPPTVRSMGVVFAGGYVQNSAFVSHTYSAVRFQPQYGQSPVVLNHASLRSG